MRKEKIITVDDRGRQLTFKIKEMPALKLESWILRAAMLLAGSGVMDNGLAKRAKDASNAMQTAEAMESVGGLLAEQGLKGLASIEYDKAEPLLAELLECCSRVDAGIEQKMTPDIVDAVIEDVRTLFTLRKEAFMINFGFFVSAGASVSETGRTPQEASYVRKISVRSPR